MFQLELHTTYIYFFKKKKMNPSKEIKIKNYKRRLMWDSKPPQKEELAELFTV